MRRALDFAKKKNLALAANFPNAGNHRRPQDENNATLSNNSAHSEGTTTMKAQSKAHHFPYEEELLNDPYATGEDHLRLSISLSLSRVRAPPHMCSPCLLQI